MSANRIVVNAALKGDECCAIDDFCLKNRGVEALPALAGFLRERFGVELALDPAVVEGFAIDSSNLPGSAQALARPAAERECAAVLRACFRAGIPVTISGGKSNLTGSATPQGGVVLSTARWLEPAVAVDAAAKLATVPPGIRLEEMRNLVLSQTGKKLAFPVDPTSRADASVGGCLACNASGFTPGEAGAMRDWIESLRFMLPNGDLVEAKRGQYLSAGGKFVLAGPDGEAEWVVPAYDRPRIKNAGGPYSSPQGELDFVDLVIGSEGIFGLVTSCVLRLAERPAEYLDLFFSLPGEAEALRLLEAARAHYSGNLSSLSAFEYFGVHCRKYMKHADRFFHGEDQVGVYIQEPLFDREPEDAAETWLEILAEAELDLPEEAILLLDTTALRTLFMEARHSMPANALEVVQHRGTFTIMTDTVVPADRFAEFLDFTHERLNSAQLDYLSFGHLGDCHLHFTVLPTKEKIDAGVAAYDDIIAKSADLGGVYSGEHGTGKRKRKDFLRCYGQTAVDQVRACKAAVDPQLIFNRGNVIEVG